MSEILSPTPYLSLYFPITLSCHVKLTNSLFIIADKIGKNLRSGMAPAIVSIQSIKNYDNIGHYIEQAKPKRGKFNYPDCPSKVYTICCKCEFFICIEHFKEYHI